MKINMIHKELFIILIALLIPLNHLYSQSVLTQQVRKIQHSDNKIVCSPNISIEKIKVDDIYECTKDTNNNIGYGFVSSINYNKINKKLYLCSTKVGKIFIFNENLHYLGIFGKYGQGKGEYVYPLYVDFNNNGRHLISDRRLNKSIVLEQDGSFFNNLPYYGEDPGYSLFYSQDLVLEYYPKKDSDCLFLLFNVNGDTIKTIGKRFTVDKNYDLIYNRLFFILDNERSIYCAFVNHPLLRKYDKNGNVVFEGDYSNLYGISRFVSQREKEIKEEYDTTVSNTTYITPNFIRDVSIDNKYFYILYNNKPSASIYVFDKTNFSVVKIVELYNKSLIPLTLFKICAVSHNLIYALCYEGIVKFKL